jgi:hypothetical protein
VGTLDGRGCAVCLYPSPSLSSCSARVYISHRGIEFIPWSAHDEYALVRTGNYDESLVVVQGPADSRPEPMLVLGTAPTLLMFGCKCWVGVAPTSFFVWLQE